MLKQKEEQEIIRNALTNIRDFGKIESKTRLHYNMKIISILTQYCYENPDVRFHQALFNLSINEFSEGTKNDIAKMSYDHRNTTLKDKYTEESSATYLKLQQI